MNYFRFHSLSECLRAFHSGKISLDQTRKLIGKKTVSFMIQGFLFGASFGLVLAMGIWQSL